MPKGWYGESERHSDAAKKANQGRIRGLLRQTRGMLGMVVSVAAMALVLPIRGLGVLRQQVAGTWTNVGRAWDYLTFDNLLPPSFVGLIQWGIETTPKLFGVRDTSPWQQLGAAVTVVIVAIVGTVASGGVLIGVLVFVGGLGIIALIRHVPAINEKWNSATGLLPVKDDYDVPRWRRD